MSGRGAQILADWMRVVRGILPAAALLAVIDVAAVAWMLHARDLAAAQLVTAVARDLAWCIVLLAGASLPIGLGLVLARAVVPGAGRLTDGRLAFLGATGLAALLCAVGIHHHLEAATAPAPERLVWFGTLAVLLAGIAGLGLAAGRGSGWRRFARHPLFAISLMAPVPLALSVAADAAEPPGSGASASSDASPALAHPPPGGTQRPRAIALITLDTTRFDAVGYSGSGRTRTPVLDRLAEEGAAFLQATTPTPLTLPAHTSMMTGLSPRSHGVVVNGMRVPRDVPVLAEQLRARGWQTAAFVAAEVVEAGTGLSRGFERYDDVLGGSRLPAKALVTARLVRRLGWFRAHQRSGADVTRRALRWIERADDRPAFLWVHYFDSHWPYTPSNASCQHAEELARLTPEQRRQFEAADVSPAWVLEHMHELNNQSEAADDSPAWFVEHMHELYDREVEEIDGHVGELLAGLDRRGWLDSSLLIAVADHGESFRGASAFGHADTLSDSTIQIPLIVRWPGVVPPGVRPKTLASVEDVNATVLAAAGLEPSLAGANSIGLVRSVRDPGADMVREFTMHETYPHPMASFGEKLRAVRTDTDKLVVAPQSSREEFFHLDDASSEERDRVDDTTRSAALSKLRSVLELVDASSEPLSRAEMIDDPQTLEMLRSLGYID